MAHTPIASVTYDGSQGTGPYPLPFHVPRSSELVVTVGGVPKFVTTDWTTDTPNLNLTLLVSAGGAEVIISRDTSEDEDDFPVTFTNGAPITKANLDDAFHHLLHLIQERDDDVHRLEDDIDDIPDGPPGPAGPAGPPGAPGDPGLTWEGTWSSLTTYAPGDAVTFGGASYIALTTTLNDQPDISPLDWDVLADQGAAGPAGPAGADGGGEEFAFMGF